MSDKLHVILESQGPVVILDDIPVEPASDAFYDKIPWIGNTEKEKEKGLRYNNNKLRWSLVEYKALEPMVKVLMYGAKKYTVGDVSGDHNWKKGLDKTEILESMMRHLTALINGETHDPESGELHIGHIQCNALFWSYFNQKEA